MDIWHKARSFAEEAAKRSQQLTSSSGSKFVDIVSETAKKSKEIAAEATKRSHELTIGGSKFTDIVSETAKEIAAEASKRADQIRAEALKGADKIKLLAEGIGTTTTEGGVVVNEEEEDPVRFGVTDELREFVKEITIDTFRNFPLEDDSEISEVPTVTNVRQDLSKWQEKHAKLVLSTVKEISKLRYELCPRFMKERKFWRIYFLIVNTHVAPYEKRYTEEVLKEEEVKNETPKETTPTHDAKPADGKIKASTSASEQDLDVFLLGDLGDSDDGGQDDDDDVDFDDDFDKMAESSDDDKQKDK